MRRWNGLKIPRLHALSLGVLLSACGTPMDPNQPTVALYVMNGWQDTVTFELYDLVCSRGLRDVRLRASEGVEIEACADADGRASIRYRREGIAAAGRPWTRSGPLRANQQVLMQ